VVATHAAGKANLPWRLGREDDCRRASPRQPPIDVRRREHDSIRTVVRVVAVENDVQRDTGARDDRLRSVTVVDDHLNRLVVSWSRSRMHPLRVHHRSVPRAVGLATRRWCDRPFASRSRRSTSTRTDRYCVDRSPSRSIDRRRSASSDGRAATTCWARPATGRSAGTVAGSDPTWPHTRQACQTAAARSPVGASALMAGRTPRPSSQQRHGPVRCTQRCASPARRTAG